MLFNLIQVEGVAGTPRTTDDLGRAIYPYLHALLIVGKHDGDRAPIAVRVATEDGECRAGDGLRSAVDAVRIAALLRRAGARVPSIDLRREVERLPGRLRRGGELPRVRASRSAAAREMGMRRRRRRFASVDPFNRTILEAELRTRPRIVRLSPHVVSVQFDNVGVTLTHGASSAVVVSAPDGVDRGTASPGVARALLHVLDADTRLRRGGRSTPDLRDAVVRPLLSRSVVTAADAGSGSSVEERDSLPLLCDAAERACPGLWGHFIGGPGLGSDAGLAVAVLDDAVGHALTPGPAADIKEVLGSILGAPEPVAGTDAQLWLSRRGFVELRRTFHGFGFAGLAVTNPHRIEYGDVVLDGPRAVAVAAALRLSALWEGSGGSDVRTARTRAGVALRDFIDRRADIADRYGWFTDPLTLMPVAERTTGAYRARWSEARDRLGPASEGPESDR